MNDFTDWLEYEYERPITDDYDYYLARQIYRSIYQPNLFFVGLNPRWQMYKFLPKGLNVMHSAGGYWDETGKRWRRDQFKRDFGLRWLDSGGFSMLNRYCEYPFTSTNYANLIVILKPDYYATMDYPCEPEISRSLGLMTNAERIKRTVENAMELAEYESQLPGKLVPVIQGYTLDEYLMCLELYDKVGLIRDYMAVGSMCRRMGGKELGNLIVPIYHAAKSLGCDRLHFFGLKISESIQVYDEFIWSRDSAASLTVYDAQLRRKWGGKRYPKGQYQKQQAFDVFIKKLDDLGLKYLSTQRVYQGGSGDT